MTIQEKIEKLDEEILNLQRQKEYLLMEWKAGSLSFAEKREAWNLSDNKVKIRDAFELRQYPHLYDYFKDRELYRYKTYDLYDHFCDDIDVDGHSEEEIDEKMKLVLLEIFDNNLGSYRYDW